MYTAYNQTFFTYKFLETAIISLQSDVNVMSAASVPTWIEIFILDPFIGCMDIVFTHGIWLRYGSGLYLKKRKV